MKQKREGGSSLPFFIYVPYHFSFPKATHLIALLRFSKQHAFSHFFVFSKLRAFSHCPFFQNETPHFTFTRDTTAVFLHFALRSEPRGLSLRKKSDKGRNRDGHKYRKHKICRFHLSASQHICSNKDDNKRAGN